MSINVPYAPTRSLVRVKNCKTLYSIDHFVITDNVLTSTDPPISGRIEEIILDYTINNNGMRSVITLDNNRRVTGGRHGPFT